MFKHGFTQGNRLVIHTAVDERPEKDRIQEYIKGFQRAFADPRYEPGHTVIVGAHVSGGVFNNPDNLYQLAKAVASGKPRLISLIVYGDPMVADNNFKMFKDFLKAHGVDLDWHYDLQSTLDVADREKTKNANRLCQRG